MKNYDKLKSIIQAANPEIMELKFGCELKKSGYDFIVVGTMPTGEPITVKKEGAYDENKGPGAHLDKFEEGKTEILGRPIRIADIILTINNFPGTDWQWKKSTRNYFFSDGDWDLTLDNLDRQSEETKQFLIDLLV